MANSLARYRILGVEHAAILKAGLNNERQRVTITGSPTGGTFTLTYSSQTTGPISYNANPQAIQQALEALTNVAPGDVIVSGGPLPATPVDIEFAGALGGLDVTLVTTTASFTGGTSPAAAVTVIAAGAAGTAVVQHDLHFINNVGFDVQQQDVAFEGDQQAVRKFFLNGVVINVACDTYDVAAISEAFDKQVVTGGLPSGVAGRVYFGDNTETAGVKCGLLAQIKAENLTTQLIETLQFVAPICVLSIVRPPVLAYNAKAQLQLTFTAEKTSVDIAGVGLPGVPSGGAFWYLDNSLG